MTLLTELLDAGWHEFREGEKWVAERFHARPGYTSSVIRVEAASSSSLNEAVALRQSQLTGTEEPIKDTITNDGTTVTGEQHEALKTDGVLTHEQAAALASPPSVDAPAAADSAEPESQSTPYGDADPSRAGEPAADSASTSEPTSSTPTDSPEQTSTGVQVAEGMSDTTTQA